MPAGGYKFAGLQDDKVYGIKQRQGAPYSVYRRKGAPFACPDESGKRADIRRLGKWTKTL